MMRAMKILTFVVLLTFCSFTFASTKSVDMIIEADYLVTMNAANEIIRFGAIAVKNGEIISVDKASKVHQQFHSDQVVSGKDRIVLPGLVNGHGHMAMTLLRGLADDLNLMTWLNDFIFPAEVEFVDETFVRVGTDLACWEMLNGGSTTVVDMYYYPDSVAQSLEDCGLRGIVAATVIGQESPDAKTPELGLARATRFAKKWKHKNSRVTPAFGPHAIYTTPPELLIQIRDAAAELDVPLSMHIAESRSEIQFSKTNYEQATITLLDGIGFFDKEVKVIGAHVVWPTETEIAILNKHNVGAIHNPTSNMKITAGVAPVDKLQLGGVNVGLGTDGAASNNDLNMWEEMRMATLLQKITNGDPTQLPAQKVLRMATIEGANAIGLGKQIGSLVAGKRADIIQVQLTGPHMQPIYDVTSHLVYTANSEDVVTVIVDGEMLVKNKEFLRLDTQAIRSKVIEFQKAIGAAMLKATNSNGGY